MTYKWPGQLVCEGGGLATLNFTVDCWAGEVGVYVWGGEEEGPERGLKRWGDQVRWQAGWWKGGGERWVEVRGETGTRYEGRNRGEV